jgi:hypothetical protein
MAKTGLPDVKKLLQFADSERFRQFEREVEDALEGEVLDRKERLEEARRGREKKARRRRLKKQAQMAN